MWYTESIATEGRLNPSQKDKGEGGPLMRASSLGTLVLYLRDKGHAEGRFDGLDTIDLAPELLEAEVIIAGIRGENDNSIGAELRAGRANSDAANLIRLKVQRSLYSYPTLLDSIDKNGYVPQNLRAALLVHWERLSAEPLGAEGNCVAIDIMSAAEKAPDDYREAICRLIKGQGPQQVGEELGVNGSRLVGKALKHISCVLEGRVYGKRKRSRKWKGLSNETNQTTAR